jgi:hypothetical protein
VPRTLGSSATRASSSWPSRNGSPPGRRPRCASGQTGLCSTRWFLVPLRFLACRPTPQREKAPSEHKYLSDFARKYYGEGQAEGEVNGAREALLTAVTVRGLALDEEARARIAACSDIATLKAWLVNAIRSAKIGRVHPRRRSAMSLRTASASTGRDNTRAIAGDDPRTDATALSLATKTMRRATSGCPFAAIE